MGCDLFTSLYFNCRPCLPPGAGGPKKGGAKKIILCYSPYLYPYSFNKENAEIQISPYTLSNAFIGPPLTPPSLEHGAL